MLENTIEEVAGAQRQLHTSPASKVFDADAALDRLDGDVELFEMLITVFQQDSVELLNRLSTGLASGNLELVERSAHSLKGLAANFDAKDATQVALTIEELARARNAAPIARLASELTVQLDKLRQALAQWEAN
jgi:HPt (histidine-containing phosphotransfer) domain-containing protein